MAVVVVADSGSAEVRVVESIGAEVVVGVVVLVVPWLPRSELVVVSLANAPVVWLDSELVEVESCTTATVDVGAKVVVVRPAVVLGATVVTVCDASIVEDGGVVVVVSWAGSVESVPSCACTIGVAAVVPA
ncbi:hypothetical protein JYT35_00290 [Acidimicrobium ferrooxidans]|uniref:Uncharacterized protein n=1 Tax=Acidimicrobium ferrooxidans TaxID=53635 RepID=A0ABS3ANX0_9ACTN|nr:hypothetical protein [Acidimicrobium ferrooxidans]MBN4059538.1 hypothetical protein [Acidimicrobium ferrooxidans]